MEVPIGYSIIRLQGSDFNYSIVLRSLKSHMRKQTKQYLNTVKALIEARS
uniref:Uncharacterized protein n=1 Tax=Meloidogyne enterolobii TaxID=390850 RepID=A0A6V7TZN5_MELEN|nr:unnamed protein product [Meloidogyne enterolobii]